jgi:Uma2 family endonuclease
MTRTFPPLSHPPIVRGKPLPMTYEEFLELPDGLHAEWVDGEAYIFMPTTEEHQDAFSLLHLLLATFVRVFDLGKVMLAPFEMVAVPDRSYREPDILFVAKEHLSRLTRQRLTEPADLAIEIVSDDSVTRDRRDKRREYEAIGVPEYWILDPRPRQHRAEFYRLGDAGTYEPIEPDAEGRVHSRVLPGFWLRPEWFWQVPLPDPDELLVEIAPTTMRARFARLAGIEKEHD